MIRSWDSVVCVSFTLGADITEYDCCGSSVPSGNKTKSVHPFDQLAIGYSFYKSMGNLEFKDYSPPNRIIDLRISMKAKSSLNIQLEWTAPGGDQDFGKGMLLV